MERIGLEKTMSNRSGINVISYDQSHSARIHPACTLPCAKKVERIYCPLSQRESEEPGSIFDAQPTQPSAWNNTLKKNMFDQYISDMKQDIF